MKYLPKKTCKYLISLGCVSESEYFYVKCNEPYPQHGEVHDIGEGEFGDCHSVESEKGIPAFSLEDILQKDNAKKIWGETDELDLLLLNGWQARTELVLYAFQYHPDIWPVEVAKLIKQ